jgi:flagellar motor switch protein FliN/FliY
LDDDAIQKMIAAAGDPDENQPPEPVATPPAENTGGSQQLDDAGIQALLSAAKMNEAAAETGPATMAKANSAATVASPSTPPPAVDASSSEVDADPGGTTETSLLDSMGFIKDIPVHISVELGRTKMNIKNILGLGKGSAIVLSNLEGETLDIRANNRLIAKGEVLVENDKYGIRIREILDAGERVGRLVG